MRHDDEGTHPSPPLFYDPLLYLLGRLSDYKVAVGIPSMLVVEDAMRLAGADAFAKLRKGKRGCGDGTRRLIRRAWKELCSGTDEQAPLCQKGTGHDQWALTPAGVQRARDLRLTHDTLYDLCHDSVTAKDLYDPVVYLVGRYSGWEARIPVSQDDVVQDALELAGVDVADYAKWPPGIQKLMRRRVQSAWMEQREGQRPGRGGLCVRPLGARAGQWGLTDAGVERARELRDTYDAAYAMYKIKITASQLYDPVIYVLAKRSNFTAYTAVPQAEVLDEALRLLGIEPTKLPTRLKDRSSQVRNGLYRRVHWAWRNQRRGYCPPERMAMCAKPSDGERGQWALTEEGVDRARGLSVVGGQLVYEPAANISAQYLGQNFGKLYERITSHLRRKMPRSEQFGKVDDHVMNWVERVIKRDGLRKHVSLGQNLPPSRICAWTKRSAYTDIRNEGRQPVCRVFHGALTPGEIDDYDPSNWTTEHTPHTLSRFENLGGNSDHDVIDRLVDQDDMESQVIGSEAFEHALGRVSEIVLAEIGEDDDPEWHQQVLLDRFVREMTVREIAEEHGIAHEGGRHKVTTAINRVRDVMLRAREEGALDDLLAP